MPKKTKNNPSRFRSYFTYNGKNYETTSTTSQKDADQRAAVKLDQLQRGEIGFSGNMSVRRWADEWIETYKKPHVINKTYKEYRRQIDKHILPAIGSERLADVKPIQLQKILNSRAGYSKSQVKSLMHAMTGIFGRARKDRLIFTDPSEDLDLPKYTSGTRRSITDFEREHFLKVAKTHHAGLMFKTMLYCGLRTGEVTALSWKDINFPGRMICVRHAMESGANSREAPKTEAGRRDVPIANAIFGEFEALSKGKKLSDPVFTQPTTGRRHTETSRQGAWNSMKNAIDDSMGAVYEKRKAKDGKMRLTKIRSAVAHDLVPYCLRHTYCTDLQDKGVPINVARYLMGHTSIEVTARIYTHMTETAIKDAAKLINTERENEPESRLENTVFLTEKSEKISYVKESSA